MLLLLCTLGAERRKGAEGMLRKKLGDGHADAAWMERAIAGHEVGSLVLGGCMPAVKGGWSHAVDRLGSVCANCAWGYEIGHTLPH